MNQMTKEIYIRTNMGRHKERGKDLEKLIEIYSNSKYFSWFAVDSVTTETLYDSRIKVDST
jgi:hypothetical protein